jgi:hypothetical protein
MDMKSHTVGCMTLRAVLLLWFTWSKGSMVGLDNGVSNILWSKLFIQEQDYPVRACTVYHDNTSSMRLEENNRDRQLWQAYMTLQHQVLLCDQSYPAQQISNWILSNWGNDLNYFTKPLVGYKIQYFDQKIMNFLSLQRAIKS